MIIRCEVSYTKTELKGVELDPTDYLHVPTGRDWMRCEPVAYGYPYCRCGAGYSPALGGGRGYRLLPYYLGCHVAVPQRDTEMAVPVAGWGSLGWTKIHS